MEMQFQDPLPAPLGSTYTNIGTKIYSLPPDCYLKPLLHNNYGVTHQLAQIPNPTFQICSW